MKQILLFSCFLNFSCAAQPYFVNPRATSEKDNFVRHCDLPIFSIADHQADPDIQKVFSESMKYWNETLDSKMFLDLGSAPYITEDMGYAFLYMYVADSPLPKSQYGQARFWWDSKGCVKKASILISPSVLSRDRTVIETTMRHELGHVLGLAHVSEITNLMNPAIESSVQHPVDATQREINDVKKLYGRTK